MNKRTIHVILLCLILTLSWTGSQIAAENARSYNRKGWEHLERGDPHRAMFAFKNALKQNPDFSRAVIGLARTYHHLEVHDRSMELYRKARRLEGDTAEILNGLAFNHIARGEFTRAMELFQAASEKQPENLEALYGIARLYYVMGRRVWAERQIDRIMRINPYHYETLLLQARIKSDDGRMEEARRLVEKAIESDQRNVMGHVALADIHFTHYLRTGDEDSFAEAEFSIRNALAISPDDYRANRLKGNMLVSRSDYEAAIPYFEKANRATDNVLMLYNLAVVYDRAGRRDEALEYYLRSIKADPEDTVSRTRFEDHLVLQNYKIAHPARIMLNREHLSLARDREKRHLADEVVMYLRRSLMLNPMDREAREMLIDYFTALGYHRFYVDQIKELLRLFPGDEYQQRLKVAVLRRRNRLYYREGYFTDKPERDVPKVLVLNLGWESGLPPHLDLGRVLGSQLSFVLDQFGRMDVLGLRTRDRMARRLGEGNRSVEEQLAELGRMKRKGEIEGYDFIVFGQAREGGSRVSATYNLYDFHRGIVINTFMLTESDREKIPRMGLRAAKRIYDSIPFHGRILKTKDRGIVVNLGLVDGIKKGSVLLIEKDVSPSPGADRETRRLVFEVKEADTLIAYAEPRREEDLLHIHSRDRVLPAKNRRAKRIQ